MKLPLFPWCAQEACAAVSRTKAAPVLAQHPRLLELPAVPIEWMSRMRAQPVPHPLVNPILHMMANGTAPLLLLLLCMLASGKLDTQESMTGSKKG